MTLTVAHPAGNAAGDDAQQFLTLLDKTADTTWLRFLRPGAGGCGADTHGLPAALPRNANTYLVIGNAHTATGPGGGVTDDDITSCPALFVEWDDNAATIEEQAQRWQGLGLPEPSITVATGGKSVHLYWLLDQPLPSPDRWRQITARLIAHCGSDPACKNPARVMRLPGSTYYDKRSGKATGRCRIIAAPGTRYALAEIEACLPQHATAPTPAAPQQLNSNLPPSSIERINAAAACIPQRVVGSGTYPEDRNALCGCSAALAAAGVADPDEAALALLGHLWPSAATARQVLNSCSTRNENAFWAIARDHGFDLRRRDLRRQQPKTQKPADEPSEPDRKPVKLSPAAVMKELPEQLGKLRLNVRTGDVHSDDGVLSGNQISRLYLQLSNDRNTWPKEATADAVALLANRNPFDPVAEYLNSNTAEPLPLEEWKRLDQHLLGINDPIAAAFLPRYLTAAVARTFDPGCEWRTSPVLVGPEKRGKTALGRILFGADHWVEGVGALDTNALQKCHRSWGVELAELNGVTRRSDRESLKAFLSERVDTYRTPYDRHPEAHPRRFLFWGTSNRPPLRDAAGGDTRYVVIPLPNRMLPLDWAAAHRDALWARAVEQYRSGIQFDRWSEEERQAIEERNANYRQIDPWAEDVKVHLDCTLEQGWALPVKVETLLEKLEVPKERRSNANAERVRELAEANGWTYGRRRPAGKRNPVMGLWPPASEPEPVHLVHPVCTPRGARDPASDTKGSGHPVHLVHPETEKVPEKKKEERVEGAESSEWGSLAVSRCTRCTPDQTDCNDKVFEVHSEVHNGVHGVHRPKEQQLEPMAPGLPDKPWHALADDLATLDPAAGSTTALKLERLGYPGVTGRQVVDLLSRLREKRAA